MRNCAAICLPTLTYWTSSVFLVGSKPLASSKPLTRSRPLTDSGPLVDSRHLVGSYSFSFKQLFSIGRSLVLGWVVLDLSRSDRSRLCRDRSWRSFPDESFSTCCNPIALGWVVLGRSFAIVLCFWNRSDNGLRYLHSCTFWRQAVQDGIHRPDESRTYIWPFIKIHLRTLDRWII